MITSLKAEIFRVVRDKFILGLFVVVPPTFLGIMMMGKYAYSLNQDTMLQSQFVGHFYTLLRFVIFVLYFVWYQEYQYDTLKNICMSKVGRTSYYLSKLIIQFVIGIVLIIWAVLNFAICFLALEKGEALTSELLIQRFMGYGLFILYMLLEISVVNFLFIHIRHEVIVFLLFFIFLNNANYFLEQILRVIGINSNIILNCTIEGCYNNVLILPVTKMNVLFVVMSVIIHVIVLNILNVYKLKRN